LSAILCLRTFNVLENKNDYNDQGEFAGSGNKELDFVTYYEEFEYESRTKTD
jgi:hypothetical protein